MRGVSIPAWTVLREPSTGSVALSEHDTHSPSPGQELVDELAHTPGPPVQIVPPIRMQPSPASRPRMDRILIGGGNGEGSSTQASGSGHRQPISPLNARRPLSSDSDEDVQQPKKKKKRKIIDPEKGAALASTRVSLGGPPPAATRLGQFPIPSLSSQLPPSTAAPVPARNRRVTLDVSILPRSQPRPVISVDKKKKSPSQLRSVPSSSVLPRQNKLRSQPSAERSARSASAAGPRQGQAPFPRKSVTSTSSSVAKRSRRENQASPERVRGGISVKSTEKVSAPPPPISKRPIYAPVNEVIEILDNDEEDAPPRPPRLKPKSKPSNTNLNRRQSLPSRPAYKPQAAVPSIKYTIDDDGVIILEDSDEDPPPPKKDPPPNNPPSTQPKETPGAEPIALQAASLSLASFSTAKSTNRHSVTKGPSMSSSDPSERLMPMPPAPDRDVDMAGEANPVPGPDEGQALLIASDFQMGDVEVDPDPELVQEIASQEHPDSESLPPEEERAEEPEEEPLRTVEPDVLISGQNVAAAASSSTDDLASRAHVPVSQRKCSPAEFTQDTMANDEGPAISSVPPLDVNAPTIPVPLVVKTQAHLLLQSSVSSSTGGFAHLRAETGSPVSSMDAQLQSLVISGTDEDANAISEQQATDSVNSIEQTTSSMSASSSSANMHSPTPPSSARTRLRMSGTLYSSPHCTKGFFKSVLRMSQKRRARSQPHTQPPTSTFAPATVPIQTTVGDSPSIIGSGFTKSQQESNRVLLATADEVPMEGILAQGGMSSSAGQVPAIDQEMNTRKETSMIGASASIKDSMASADPQQRGPSQPVAAVGLTEAPLPIGSLFITARESEIPTRSDTPPIEATPSMPLGPTLSQIIRKAANENARKKPIDLTADFSDDDRIAQSASSSVNALTSHSLTKVPASAPSADAPSAPPPAEATTPARASTPVKMVDLSAIRTIRRSHARPLRSEEQSPIKAKAPAIPLPRNMRRVGGLVVFPAATPAAPIPVESTDTTDNNFVFPSVTLPSVLESSNPSSDSSTPATQGPSKLLLPRRKDLVKAVLPTQPSTSQSPISSPVNTPSQTIFTARAPAAAGQIPTVHDPDANVGVSLPSLEVRDSANTPPRSCSPTTEEEECQNLLYPSSIKENSPEVEILDDEDEHPVRPWIGRRIRSRAVSGVSSMSGPRRSVRLTSSSASSSVEPSDELELPRIRLRRREPLIRSPSDEDITSQGGITRISRAKFAQAFEDAGFETLSWKKDRHRVAKEFAPVTQLAKDIPHDLHDRLNALSESARRAGNMQVLIFEADIRANTAEDEPSAPPIRIINEVDDEPTPPLEFYYSNKIWHGTGVPKPEYERGCNCVGPCDPMSKTCSCIKRQMRFEWDRGGFIYDKKGKLRAHEYPIFECNVNCGCSDDCQNRVIQHGRQYEIAIQKTINKGWGVFAGPKKIPAHTFIGVYAGEYLTDAEGEERGRVYDKFGRTYLFDVDFWYLNDQYGRKGKLKYCIDAYHAGNFTRYLNHSCDPNCAIVAAYINEANIEKPLLSIFTIRDVEPYEELCFSYYGDPSGNDEDDDDHDDNEEPPEFDGAVHVRCKCGTAKCSGRMWR